MNQSRQIGIYHDSQEFIMIFAAKTCCFFKKQRQIGNVENTIHYTNEP